MTKRDRRRSWNGGVGHRQYRGGATARSGHGFYGCLRRNPSDVSRAWLHHSSVDDVDRPGNRISVSKGSAYGLWLENNIKQAELKPVEGGDAAFDQFVNDGMEAYASLRPRLITEAEDARLRILDGQFAAVQQAVGVNKGNDAAYLWLKDFVEASKANGLVASFIDTFGVQGKLSVAPPA